MIDHSGHPHPSTPAARAKCRANGGTGDITSKPKEKAPAKKSTTRRKDVPTITEAKVPVASRKPELPKPRPNKTTRATVKAVQKAGVGLKLDATDDDRAQAQARQQEQAERLRRIADRQRRSVDKIANSFRSGVKDSRPLSGGMIAETSLLEFNDGTKGVQKKIADIEYGPDITPEQRRFLPSAKEQQDNEELGSLVARGIGLDAPQVMRVDEKTTVQEFKSGKVGGSLTRRDQESFVNSNEGLVMAVMDQVIGNNDRNLGNWITEGGRLHPIDFSNSWGPSEMYRNPIDKPMRLASDDFQRSLRDQRSGEFKDNDMSPADMDRIGDVLTSLRDEFANRGALEKWEWSMKRLNALRPFAKGTVRRIR